MNYGLDPEHLRLLVIRPALQHIGLHSMAAENLVLGTALVESELRALKQRGKGPALGLWQMEPRTLRGLLAWLDEDAAPLSRKRVRDALWQMTGPAPYDVSSLPGNLFLGAGMCRVHYYNNAAPLPRVAHAQGMAEYWKRWYNTRAGKGTVAKALPHFEFACA
jgi:hypothetical protein